MIITNVECFHIGLPMTLGNESHSQQADWAVKNIATLNHLLVKVTTENGLIGWGEAFAFKGGEAIAAIVDKLLKPSLIGADSSKICDINLRLQHENHLWGRYGMTMFAISAVDIALWDIAAKRAEQPLYKLLNPQAKAQNITCYASLPRYADADMAIKISNQAIAEGYKVIKLHEADVDVILAVREAFGDDIGLMTDVNCSWNHQQAMDAAQRLQSANLIQIEEPIFPPEDFKTLSQLNQHCGIPIASGECACTAVEFEQMLNSQAVTFVQPSVAKVGGITEFIKVHQLIKQFQARGDKLHLMPHSPYMGPAYLASMHLITALQPESMLERLYLQEIPKDFYSGQFKPKGGETIVSKNIGLGDEPKMSIIEEHLL